MSHTKRTKESFWLVRTTNNLGDDDANVERHVLFAVEIALCLISALELLNWEDKIDFTKKYSYIDFVANNISLGSDMHEFIHKNGWYLHDIERFTEHLEIIAKLKTICDTSTGSNCTIL